MGGGMRNVLSVLPLLGVPVGLYVLLALVDGGARGTDVFVSGIQDNRVGVPLPSGGTWAVSGGDLLVGFGLVLLFAELIRGVGASRLGIIHHTLSVLLALGSLGLFLIAEPFATSAFFLLTLMCWLDAASGIIVNVASNGAGEDR
jgi:hypothetical protein